MHRANVTSIAEVYKLRKVLERIEKKLDNYMEEEIAACYDEESEEWEDESE